jgi:pimeloyl-ACP methyl ester carboxylesterase
MAVFVLVHGAWHGAWCWQRLRPLLEADGHGVHTPDLPGHGADRTPRAGVSMPAYIDRVVDAVDAAGGPVILVGHSMGGMVISGVAEARPASIALLVYLTASLPRDGESLFDLEAMNPSTSLRDGMSMSADGSAAHVRDDRLQALFYQDCPDADIALAREHLVPQAMTPMVEMLALTADGFGRVPKHYIMCSADRALVPAFQQAQLARYPGLPVSTLDTGHSPFFARPRALADLLSGLAVTANT